MGYCKQSALPDQEPVSLAQAKLFLRLNSGYIAEDAYITGLIQSAREDGERASGRCLAQRPFEQVLDAFPYYTDSIQSGAAFPPGFYSLPRYSTSLWNYSQMIKLERAPLISVDNLTYVDASGNLATLESGFDFIVDPETEMARIFPMVGQYWPPALYTPNSVKISFTAGYDPDPTVVRIYTLPSPPPSPPNQQTSYAIVTGIPQVFIDGILNLVAYKFQNRGGGDEKQLARIMAAFENNGIVDFSPTRG